MASYGEGSQVEQPVDSLETVGERTYRIARRIERANSYLSRIVASIDSKFKAEPMNEVSKPLPEGFIQRTGFHKNIMEEELAKLERMIESLIQITGTKPEPQSDAISR